MYIKILNKFVILWIFALLFTVTSCLNQRQDPTAIFESNDMPTVIDKLANPEISENDDRIKAKDYHGRMDVAVIDNGVDYIHPELISQIHFNFQNGKLISVGKDFLGNDNFAYPSIVDASLFAFGAEKIEKGMIVGPLEDPLALLLYLNEQFMKRLESAIQLSPVLRTSLFRKINVSNTNIFGLKNYYAFLYDKFVSIEDEDSKKSVRKMFINMYKDARENDQLFSNNARDNAHFKNYLADTGAFRLILDLPWKMSSNGIPKMSEVSTPLSSHSAMSIEFNVLMRFLENADEFLPVLEKTYSDFNKEFKFEEKLQTYVDYHYYAGNNKLSEAPSYEFYKSLYPRLAEIIYTERSNYNFDVIEQTTDDFCGLLLSEQEIAYLNSQEFDNVQKISFVKNHFDNFFSFANKIFAYVEKSHSFNLQEQEAAAIILERIPKYMPIFDSFIRTRGYDLFFCNPIKEQNIGNNDVDFSLTGDFKNEYKKHYKVIRSPFVNKDKNGDPTQPCLRPFQN